MRRILKGGQLLDLQREERRVVDLELDGPVISKVADHIEAGPGDAVTNIDGCSLLPGMTNCHAHLGWDGVRDLEEQSIESDEITAWRCAMNVQRCIASGLTRIRDLGMNTGNMFAKKAVSLGLAPPLKVVPVARAITMTGGHTWWCCREADGIEDCRRAVREQVKDGAEWIKVMGNHHWPQFPVGTPPVPQFTEDELLTLVSEAHANGLKVTACVGYDAAISRVVRAGVDCIEHGGSMSESTIEMMLERGTWLVTTFSPLVIQAERGLELGMPREAVEHRKWQLADGARFDGVRRAAAAGVPIAFGTDAGSPLVPHGEIVPELKFMVQIGVCADNWAALRAITSSPAKLLGAESGTGTIEPGKTADIVIVDGDPVRDLEELRRVRAVLVEGAVAYGGGRGYSQVS